MSNLFAVTDYEANRPRVLVLWTDPWDFERFDEVCAELNMQEYRVLNVADEVPSDEVDLKDYLKALASATHISLPSTWWTSVVAHQLVQVAGWLGLSFLDHEGREVPTLSLKGASA